MDIVVDILASNAAAFDDQGFTLIYILSEIHGPNSENTANLSKI